MKKINKKIPGHLPPLSKKEFDGKITDLSTKTVAELLELRERQLKLLKNKRFVSTLADKGAKIKTFHDKIEKMLQEKQQQEQVCRLINNLKLDTGENLNIQDLEWQSKKENKKILLDSDDDSDPEDVLQILSQSTATEKKVIVQKQENTAITCEDILKIGDIPHVKYLVEKAEAAPACNAAGHFKPFKTTLSDVHNPKKEILRKQSKHWEVTAATPPPIKHEPAKLLTLEESLKLQRNFNINLKNVEARHAAEKLMARSGIKMADFPQDCHSHFGNYREANVLDSDDDPSDSTDTEEPERGGVVFTVME